MKTIAIIPARGGSQRVSKKNIRLIGGIPLLAHSIRIAKSSGCFDEIYVSTDSKDIEHVARFEKAQVLHRTDLTSGNNVPLLPVIQEAIGQIGENEIDYACMILPTAIFLDPNVLKQAATFLNNDHDLDYVISVAEFPSSPQRALILDASSKPTMVQPNHFTTRSQDLDTHFYDAGQFSFGRSDAWLSGKPSFSANTRAIQIEKYSSVDIDTAEDFSFAEKLWRLKMATFADELK